MAALALPISRDDFIYHGQLYVDAGNMNRHPRASVAELTEFFRPKLSETNATLLPKDQVGHWNEAQLVHYGLSRTKNKSTAKVRLFDALNSGKLAVPA